MKWCGVWMSAAKERVPLLVKAPGQGASIQEGPKPAMAFCPQRLPHRNLSMIASVGLAAVLAGAASAPPRAASPRYMTAVVERGDITAVVRATGVVRATCVVPVGAAVPGTVQEVFVEFAARVRAGQTLVQLDPAPFKAELTKARDELAQAEAKVKRLEASLPVLQATVETRQARLNRVRAAAEIARAEAARVANLFQQGILPQAQQDESQASLQQAEDKVHAAEAEFDQAQAQLEQARGELEPWRLQVTTRREAVDRAETNLRHTTIVAPIDGMVVARRVRPGQSLAISLSPSPLILIAPNLKTMLLDARIEESEAAQIPVGTEVSLQTDAFPAELFRGRVRALQPSPGEAHGPAMREMVIEFDNIGERLLPGITAFVTVPTGHAADTLKVPSRALRFTPAIPARELQTLLEKHKILLAARAPTEGWHVVWRLKSRKVIEPVAVRVGITDHRFAQLLEGSLKEGDALVIGQLARQRARPRGAAVTPGVKREYPRR